MKILTVVGTRPEIIRLSRVITRLDEFTDHVLVHTGQNYDYELNQVFFEDLELRRPDYFLEVDTSSLGSSIGDIMRKTEQVLQKEKPNALLVLGDTNSCLSAYIARRMHIPIFHMEAGNRCYDFNVPEETNRRLIDHISDYNLVYTEHARRHLIAEGLSQRRIYLTGSPMYEVLKYYLPRINSSTILQSLQLKEKKYFVVSTHREENVDSKMNLKKIINVLKRIEQYYNYPIVVSTHPRTRKRLDQLSEEFSSEKILFMKPFSFSDYVYLQMKSFCVISDSGTISEESAILNFPAVSLRESMERPEAQDSGSIILTGFDEEVILKAIKVVVSQKESKNAITIPAEYKVENSSWRVLNLIIGNSGLSNKWDGIKGNED